MGETVTAAVAVSAALAILVVALVVVRRAAARSERRFATVLEQLDLHMHAISRSLEAVVERSEEARVGEVGLTLDLRELLERLAAEAVARTGAQAAAVRVRGPGDEPAVAAVGVEDSVVLLEASLGPPRSPPFRAVTLSWSYAPALEEEAGVFRSAVVVPVVEDGEETGVLGVFATAAGALRPDHARMLEALVEDAAPGLRNARRFAEAELRAVTDALTGVRNRRGYDEELEREAARARRTGRPLSLLLVDLDDFAEVNNRFDYPGGDLVLREFAEALSEAARITDTVCRRGGDEFAVLLPETSGDEARQFYARLKELVAARSFSHVGRVAFSAGLVQWRENESRDSLDARASAAVNRAKHNGKGRLETDLP
jgi:diguanylate cyclase (GGDEF)-like protein